VKVVFVALDAGDVHFHFDNAGVDAVNGGAESFVKHPGGIAGEGNPALTYLVGRAFYVMDVTESGDRWDL
jgi:hypothetical protein